MSRAVGPVITLTGEQAERACHTQDPAGHVPGHSDCTLAAELARTALCPLAGLHGVIYEASARTTFLHKCPRHRSPESLPGGGSCFHSLLESHTPGSLGAHVHAGLAYSRRVSSFRSRARSPHRRGPHRERTTASSSYHRFLLVDSRSRNLIKDTPILPDGNSCGGVSASTERAVFGFQERCDIFSESQVALGLAIPIGKRNMSCAVPPADLPGPASGRLQDSPGGPWQAGWGCPKPSATWLPEQI